VANKHTPLLLLGGILLGGAFAFSGWTAATGMRQAANEQSAALDNMRAWRSAYEALRPVEDRWRENYQEGVDNHRQDLVEVARSLRLDEAGLTYSDKGLRSEVVESINYEGIEIGLIRTCVTDQSQGFPVQAETMAGLVRGLERLNRKDLSLDGIETRVEAGVPTAVLEKLCVMVRSPEGA